MFCTGRFGIPARASSSDCQPVPLDTYCPVRSEGPGKFDPLLAEKMQTGNAMMRICDLISDGYDAFVVPAHFLLITDGNTLKTGVVRIKQTVRAIQEVPYEENCLYLIGCHHDCLSHEPGLQ